MCPACLTTTLALVTAGSSFRWYVPRQRRRSTGGVRIRKPDEARRSETRPTIPRHLAEPPPLFPVSTCVGDLLRRPRHKVPPHQNFLWERWTADQQQSAARPARETDRGTIGAKVIQHSLLQRRFPFTGSTRVTVNAPSEMSRPGNDSN